MEKAINVAACIYKVYHKKYNKGVTEMTLHQLMYLVQKEHLARKKEPLFDDTIRAWIHGPVVLCVRTAFKKKLFLTASDNYPDVSHEAFNHITRVVTKYGSIEPWTLSDMIKNAYAWTYTRDNRAENDNSPVITNEIILEEIKQDNLAHGHEVSNQTRQVRKNTHDRNKQFKDTKPRNPMIGKGVIKKQYNHENKDEQTKKFTKKTYDKKPMVKDKPVHKPTEKHDRLPHKSFTKPSPKPPVESRYNEYKPTQSLSDDQISAIMKKIDKENGRYSKSRGKRRRR